MCSICRGEVIAAIKSLSAKASEAILNPETASNDPIAADEHEDEEEDDLAGLGSDESSYLSIDDSCLQLRQQICSWGLICGPGPCLSYLSSCGAEQTENSIGTRAFIGLSRLI